MEDQVVLLTGWLSAISSVLSGALPEKMQKMSQAALRIVFGKCAEVSQDP